MSRIRSVIVKAFKTLLEVLKKSPLLILIWILLKGALVALVVAFIILLSKKALAYFAISTGSWPIKYLEIIHESFSLLIFMISCMHDLMEYLKGKNKPKHKLGTKKHK